MVAKPTSVLSLQDKCVYLRIRPDGRTTHKADVRFFDDYLAALRDWDETCRVSPLVPFRGVTLPRLHTRFTSWLLFVGPIFPGGLSKVWRSSWPKWMWLTFGMHNVVIWNPDKRQSDEILAAILAGASDTPWERWQLNRGRILKIESSSDSQDSTRSKITHSAEPIGAALSRNLAMSREYEGHIRTSIAAAHRFDPRLGLDFLEFDQLFRETLRRADVDQLSRIGLLGNATAILLRHNSQAYSGTAPILEWPCSIAQHSLLGIGTANMGLASLRRFFQRKADSYSPISKIDALAHTDIPEKTPPAGELTSRGTFWSIINAAGEHESAGVRTARPDRLPLLTCFSSRDGFRSTPTSLSAPLEVVESSNTQSWTPMIVTHELSHLLVDNSLTTLLPSTPTQLAKATRLLSGDIQPGNAKEWIQQLLLEGFWVFSGQAGKLPTPDSLATAIRMHHEHVDEILTDSFDYLCFYRGNEERFVRTIWSSLSVFPYIGGRLSEYIIRTLAALHALHFTEPEGTNGRAHHLLTMLKKAEAEGHGTAFISAAVIELQKDPQHYEDLLSICVPLVKFARLVLAPPSMVKHFSDEPHTARSRAQSARGRGGYTLRPLTFTGELPHNPVRFLESYSTDKDPSPARSLWLWHHLAFWNVQ